MRYGIYEDFSSRTHQVMDDERYMLIDTVTGRAERFGPNLHAVGSKEEVLKQMLRSPQAPIRYVAVRLDCIASVPWVRGEAVSQELKS